MEKIDLTQLREKEEYFKCLLLNLKLSDDNRETLNKLQEKLDIVQKEIKEALEETFIRR